MARVRSEKNLEPPVGRRLFSDRGRERNLYTEFRRNSKDVVTALDAASGKTIWEFEYESPFTNSFAEQVGPGPYAMPQVVGDRVIATGATGKIFSLDKKPGRSVWSRDLYKEFHATRLIYGYSCHALPYKDTLIFLPAGVATLLLRSARTMEH